jgi:hypothetical protein
LGDPRLKGWPGELKRLLLERHDLGAELAALGGKQRRIEHHPVALHRKETSRTGISIAA